MMRTISLQSTKTGQRKFRTQENGLMVKIPDICKQQQQQTSFEL
jgi:hypothetical protein